MSDNKNNIPNEDELWNLLSEPVSTEPAAPKAPEKKARPEPEQKAEPARAAEPKSGRKLDGFFYTCMSGVAAVSVAATLLISSLGGGNAADPAKPVTGEPGETVSSSVADLERENAELKAKLEQQKAQIKELQNDLMTLMGSEEYLSTMTTNPDESNEVLDAQLKALDTLAQIQEAYADFDMDRLEELIPEMDAQLTYLTPEALNNYYLILEYVEQPSNG